MAVILYLPCPSIIRKKGCFRRKISKSKSIMILTLGKRMINSRTHPYASILIDLFWKHNRKKHRYFQKMCMLLEMPLDWLSFLSFLKQFIACCPIQSRTLRSKFRSPIYRDHRGTYSILFEIQEPICWSTSLLLHLSWFCCP